MMFMQTMKDKVDFMKIRISDLELKFEKRLDGEMQMITKTVQ